MTRETRHMVLRVLVIIALGLAIVDVILLLTKSNKRVVSEKDILNYSENSKIDYKVLSKEESEEGPIFLESPYIKEKIKSIDASFMYSFLADDNLDFEYTESIVATLITRDLKGVEKFKEEFILLNEIEKAAKNTTGFTINEIRPIDYNFYTEIVNNAIKDKELDVINTKSELVVSLNVTTKSKVEKQEIESITSTKITIPLNEDEFTIKENTIQNDKTVTDKVSEVTKNEAFVNALYTLYGVAVLILIIVFINYFINKEQVNNYKSENRKVRKAVHKYEEMIFHTNDMPDLSDKVIAEIDKFDVFMAIFEKYDLMITMVEMDDYITFVMINDDKAWTYTIEKGR